MSRLALALALSASLTSLTSLTSRLAHADDDEPVYTCKDPSDSMKISVEFGRRAHSAISSCGRSG
jgi:DNA-binding IclR family transcriptional regulator